MASAFAIAIRHRALLIPWDVDYEPAATRSSGIRIAPAKQFLHRTLRSCEHTPEPQEYQWFGIGCIQVPYSTEDGRGLCFYCKRRTHKKGLHASCEQCENLSDNLATLANSEYYSIYIQSLQLASQRWQLTIPTQRVIPLTTYSLETSGLSTSELLALRLKKLKESLPTRVTKPTAD